MLKKVKLLSLLCALGYLCVLSVASSDLVNSPEDLDDESKFQENVDLDQEESENEHSEVLSEPQYSEEVASIQRGSGRMCNGRRCAKGSRCIRRCTPTCVRRKSDEGNCAAIYAPCKANEKCCDRAKFAGYCDTRYASSKDGVCFPCYKLHEECDDKKADCCQTSAPYNNACIKQGDKSTCAAGTCTFNGRPCTDGYPCCPDPEKRDNIGSVCYKNECKLCIVKGKSCSPGAQQCCSLENNSIVVCPAGGTC